jgi:hypothetical protein
MYKTFFDPVFICKYRSIGYICTDCIGCCLRIIDNYTLIYVVCDEYARNIWFVLVNKLNMNTESSSIRIDLFLPKQWPTKNGQLFMIQFVVFNANATIASRVLKC